MAFHVPSPVTTGASVAVTLQPLTESLRASAFEKKADDLRVRFEPQIPAFQRGFKESLGCRPAAPAIDGEIEGPETFLLCAVEIGIERIARLDTGLHEGIEERITAPSRRDMERAGLPVIG